MTRKFHFAELQSGSSFRYKITLFENYFLKCFKVKRIFNILQLFSEYIHNLQRTTQYVLKGLGHLLG